MQPTRRDSAGRQTTEPQPIRPGQFQTALAHSKQTQQTKTMASSNSALRLAYITNNAYDTIALMRGDKMLAHWTAEPSIIAEYLNPGDLEDWASNQTDDGEETTIGDLGEELTGDALARRLRFWAR